MSEERRYTRSQSVQPSGRPRAIGGQTPNTLSAPIASDDRAEDESRVDANQEGVLRNIIERVSDVERNIATMIETQLANALSKVMNDISNRGREREENAQRQRRSPREYHEVESENNGLEEEVIPERGNVKMPKVKIEPKLSGQKNYMHWKLMMTGQMQATNIISAIERRRDEKDQMNLYAMDFIMRSIEGVMVPHIMETKTAYEAWNKLEEYCAPKAASEIRRLRMELARVELRNDNKIDDYIGRIKRLRLELSNQGVLLDDGEIISYMLAGLGSRYETLAQIIESGEPNFDLACSKIRMLAIKYGETKPDVEKALMIKKMIKCFKCGKIGHKSNICKSEVKCFKCNKTGHISPKCPDNKTPTSNDAKEDCREVGLVTVLKASKQNTSDDEWILDSAATSHICSNEGNLQNIQDCEKYLEQLEKERSVKTTKIGEINLDGFILKDVLLVPKAHVNLISLSKALKNNGTVSFTEDNQF